MRAFTTRPARMHAHCSLSLPRHAAARWRGWRRCRWPTQHRGGRGGAGSKQQGWPQARKRVGGELGARRSSCCHPPRQAALVHEPRPARARLLQLPLLAVADEAAAVLAFVGLLALLAPLRGVRGVGGGAACWLAAACWQCCLLHACLGVVQGWLRVCARVSPLSFGRRLTSLGGPPPTHAAPRFKHTMRATVPQRHPCAGRGQRYEVWGPVKASFRTDCRAAVAHWLLAHHLHSACVHHGCLAAADWAHACKRACKCT